MKKNKVLAVFMAASIFMSFAIYGCKGSSVESTKAIIGAGEASGEAESNGAGSTTKGSNSTPTIEETVVYEKDGIKITAKEYTTESIWGDGIKFLIENDTSKNLMVSCKALIVNNYMISDLFATEVAAGKKTNEIMHLSSSQLKQSGIDVIGLIECYFHIYDNDTYDTVADTECISIKTSLYNQMDTTADESGEVLYDKGGIKIIGKYVNDSDFWGSAALFYIQNTSGKNVGIQTENVSINGFTFDAALFSATVYDGKKSYDKMTLLSSELKENGIDSVNEISLKFKIYDPDTYKEIDKSDEIKFKVK